MDVAVQTAKAAMARGDFIAAYDVAVSAIADGRESDAIHHQLVLALARMGDTERAMELFASFGLDRSLDPHQRAAGARLLKDRALAAPQGEGRRLALEAAYAAYRAIFDEGGDAYPGINAASLALLAGRDEEAKTLARAILDEQPPGDPRDYYDGATRAEALLILGRDAAAGKMLRRAAPLAGADHGARSTTCRQLALLAERLGMEGPARDRLLAPVRPPTVIHYSGHMFAAEPEVEARLGTALAAALDGEDVGFAYGSLAGGADILIAEAMLARGGELHLVLPFVEEDFIAQSVSPGGEAWLPRYRACRDAATSLSFASEMQFVGDPGQFAYASHVAMGLARLRAQHLGGQPLQIAVWDGGDATGPAGTGADVAIWAQCGGRTHVVDPAGADRGFARPPPRPDRGYERALAAILFTDFVGFSKLSESALPTFWDGVMGVVAKVLDRHPGDVATRNSWGDALYAVMPSAASAAAIALELQRELGAFDYSTLGLSLAGGGMRIGAHYGPAYKALDPITDRTTFYGTEVSRAARIEPVTPPGAVFVTEPFAAILALEAPDRFTCRYVGRIALAKGYGTFPMYRLAAK